VLEKVKVRERFHGGKGGVRVQLAISPQRLGDPKSASEKQVGR